MNTLDEWEAEARAMILEFFAAAEATGSVHHRILALIRLVRAKDAALKSAQMDLHLISCGVGCRCKDSLEALALTEELK